MFLDYTQEQLDAAYDQAEWAPNREEVIAEYASLSQAVRGRYEPQNFRYGPGEDEDLDVYPTTAARAPIVVFVHGGAWRGLSREDSAFPAPTFVDRGMCFIALEFSLIPEVRLPEMADQVRRAVAWVHAHAETFGGDPDSIHVVGHSSGAHLAAVLLTTDWSAYEVPDGVITTGTCLSGMFDLYPVLLSARSSYVLLTDQERDALSPALHLGAIDCPVLVVHGDQESPEFIRQSRSFSAALREKDNTYLVARDTNHFEVALQLGRATSTVSRAVLAHIASRLRD
ncbi:alpha/beta hydrolase [Geodermatophilus sp. DSM 44513]|uniref:alpha/beta hydrolase n=1 Tax=Geodermatophilus sp. DSM 44513 TaxID=1528104 RepID=UPI0012870645|nr:alpha/beta hydrolase [Geodermatophilus sp. DSM 44513]WNV77054.1 alpha/beta hydrolase [Geodermatophilus sp. DSM 44513]